MKIEYVLTDIQELSFKKNLNEDIQLEVQTKSDYTVFYAEDSTSCMGVLSIELIPINHEEKLQIKYKSNSIFNLKDVVLDDEIKRELHIETYNRLFPLCCTHIKSLLSTIGLPDIPILPIDFSQSNININNL